MMMMTGACVTVAPLTAHTLPRSDWPADTQVRWYDVTGGTAGELRAQLDLHSPEDAAGVHHDAYTEWYVTWHFPLVMSESGCSTGPVATTLRVKVSFPRWQAAPGVDQLLLEQWERYLQALFEHESGHRDTALRAAHEISEVLGAFEQLPSCPEAETVASAAHAVLEKYRKADLDYDVETRHGETQGAVFP
jgi:predicted secreted Zn-dependent protease